MNGRSVQGGRKQPKLAVVSFFRGDGKQGSVQLQPQATFCAPRRTNKKQPFDAQLRMCRRFLSQRSLAELLCVIDRSVAPPPILVQLHATSPLIPIMPPPFMAETQTQQRDRNSIMANQNAAATTPQAGSSITLSISTVDRESEMQREKEMKDNNRLLLARDTASTYVFDFACTTMQASKQRASFIRSCEFAMMMMMMIFMRGLRLVDGAPRLDRAGEVV